VRIAARAPNHLGDGVMALPALHALSELGTLTIYAPRWGASLYRDVSAAVSPRGVMARSDAAVLFAPSLRAALESRWCVRRIGVSGDHRRWLLTDVVDSETHRSDTYRRLAEVLGAQVSDRPRFRVRSGDPTPEVPDGHIGLNPISVSGAPVEWTGFAELARGLGAPVVFYGGPGERDRVEAIAKGYPSQVGLPLPAFAAALRRCAVFVSNDSGAAHFARACGTPTVVVYGSTVPSRTGPAGAIAVEGPSPPCRPCYAKRCDQGLGCLDIDVDRVLEAVERAHV
jgi:ADP-heptose:LPS heptosyltransferase